MAAKPRRTPLGPSRAGDRVWARPQRIAAPAIMRAKGVRAMAVYKSMVISGQESFCMSAIKGMNIARMMNKTQQPITINRTGGRAIRIHRDRERTRS